MKRQQPKRKPRQPRKLKQPSKPRQPTLQKLRQECIKQTAFLAPKTLLKCRKAINRMLLQQHLHGLQHAAINQAHDNDTLSTYNDLDDFHITPRTALSTMINTITTKPTHEMLPPLDNTNHSNIISQQIPDKFNNTNLFSQPYYPITSPQLERTEAVHYLRQQQHNTEPEPFEHISFSFLTIGVANVKLSVVVLVAILCDGELGVMDVFVALSVCI